LVSDAKAGDKFTFFCVFPSVLHLPNTQLTSTDSGHSDQEEAKSDLEEEDGMDESALFLYPRYHSLIRIHLVLITSDEKHIIDDVRLHLNQSLGVYSLTRFQELKVILVNDLPVGCTLLVVFSRLFSTHAIPEPCSIFPITIAIVSTSHGNPKANAEQ
jgi:hypothetical protein